MTEVIAGLVVGICFVLFGRFTHDEIRLYSLGLIGLPLVYAAFAVYAGQGSVAALEMSWGLPYFIGGILLPLLSVRKSTMLIGALWAVHGLYDLGHGYLFTNAGVPDWYPAVCAGADLLVGMYLLVLPHKVSELKSSSV